MSFQANASSLRDSRETRRLPCLGCQRTVTSADSWAICSLCQSAANTVISARLRGMSGPEYRAAANTIRGSQERMAAVLAEARQGVA